MWWMLILLSPDTLSVDERTDPPHMVLKKQSQTVSSTAYSQRNAHNAVSGSDRMLSRELAVGAGARQWPGQAAAPCWLQLGTACAGSWGSLPWPQGDQGPLCLCHLC